MKERDENAIGCAYTCVMEYGIQKTLNRLWAVLVRDGEQFIAGEIRKIAEDYGIEL